jgi:hypothetical protein
MLNREWSPEDGEPVRNYNHSHYGKHIVFFPSQKNSKQIICESRHEADYCVVLELDKNVRTYFLQPVTADFRYGRKTIHYTPDFFVRTHDHTDYFSEVKPTFDPCSPGYLQILHLFEKQARKFHYGFLKIEDSPPEQLTRKSTLQTLYLRSLQATEIEYQYLVNEIQGKSSLTIGELLMQSDPPSMRAIAKAIIQGVIWIDLKKPLNLNTLLVLGSSK